MRHPYDSSSQRDSFLGTIGLLAVAAVVSLSAGSVFGFLVLAVLIGILWTRAQWARIVTMVVIAYVGLVGLLVSIFARGGSSFAGFVAAVMTVMIFWLLLRPGMSQYFSGGVPKHPQVLPVSARPGALPHLHQQAVPLTPTVGRSAQPTASQSTQEQWARLQQQLRAQQDKDASERAAESGQHAAPRTGFSWIIALLTAFMCSYTWSASGEFGKFIMLLVIPGYIAALARWIPAREFFLAVLLVSGGLVLEAQWTFVAPQMQRVLQHHGSGVLAILVPLAYLVAICYSGLPGACQSAS